VIYGGWFPSQCTSCNRKALEAPLTGELAVKFSETTLQGAYVIELEKLSDDRGFFARAFCKQEFEAHGLNPRIAQCNVSFNRQRGTLRGMHFQAMPFAEAKLVRCSSGAIHDVIIDLRPESKNFKRHFAVELSARNGRMLYIPEGFAHGFQTLEADTEVFYQMSEIYSAPHARGVRWNDPAFGIKWPEADRIIIDRDRNYPDFST
jgi:dTDP-4-dehydrorhamnose 3,5-epimerase